MIFLLSGSFLWAGSYESLTKSSPVELKDGERIQLHFNIDRPRQPVLLSIQGRIKLSEDTLPDEYNAAEDGYANLLKGAGDLRGDYCFHIMLNGRRLSPENVKVLNKKEVIDASGPTGRDTTKTVKIPLFVNGRWFLKADDGYKTGHPGAVFTTWAYHSHYYEYLFYLTDLKRGNNTVTVGVEMPEQMKDLSVEIRAIGVTKLNANFLVTANDWMEAVFPWQTPVIERTAEVLKAGGCRREYVPLAFSVYTLDTLPDIGIQVTALKHKNSSQTIPSDKTAIFQIKAIERKALGEAGFIAAMPYIPEEWTNHSPELLIPVDEEHPTVNRFQTQSFFLDIKIPENSPSGTYSGSVKILSKSNVLTEIPLEMEVFPFDLSDARQKYWMWRLTWSPVWQPENVACLKDIKEHGFTGMARESGVSFKFKVTDGKVEMDTSGYEKFVDALKESGLALSIRDTSVSNSLVRTAASYAGMDMRKLREEKKQLIDGILEQPEEVQSKIRGLVLEGFKKVKEFVDNKGLEYYVFPVDEPCGTPWRRRWTNYAAGLAKQAGLKTFSTRNNFNWDANIDYGAPGVMINFMYRKPKILNGGNYKGEIAFSPLPILGAFRGGPSYHFNGMLDDIRIYNRALTEEEMLNQHKKPTAGNLIAHYSFDNVTDNAVKDLSGEGNDAVLINSPEIKKGMVGSAVSLVSEKEQRIEPPADKKYDLSKGWSISMWYKGNGCLFGRGYEFYYEGGRVRYTTTEEKLHWSQHTRVAHDDRFWGHITYVFDPSDRSIRVYAYDEEIKKWYRENIEWNYMQVRSMPPKNPRAKTGIMSWYYGNTGNLRNITAFCYDWNFNHLYVVYPKNGDRWSGIWYGTLGWKGTREGIDAARYMQTLVNVLQEKGGMTEKQAIEKVTEVISPIGVGYEINEVIEHFGSYDNLRKKVISEILKYH